MHKGGTPYTAGGARTMACNAGAGSLSDASWQAGRPSSARVEAPSGLSQKALQTPHPIPSLAPPERDLRRLWLPALAFFALTRAFDGKGKWPVLVSIKPAFPCVGCNPPPCTTQAPLCLRNARWY